MHGRSSLLCPGALRRLTSTCRRGIFSDLNIPLQECNSAETEEIPRIFGILERNFVDFGDSAKIQSKSLGRVGSLTGRGIWQTNLPVSSSEPSAGLASGRVDWGIVQQSTSSLFLLRRTFVSSASFPVARHPPNTGSNSPVKRVRKTKVQPPGGSGRRSPLKSKSSGDPVGAKPFSGASTSVKELRSDHTRRNSQTGNGHSTSLPKSARKRIFPSSLSARISGQITGAKERSKRRLASNLRAKNKPEDDGERIKRRRKRIRPHPRDITFKRGLDDQTADMGLPVPIPEQKATDDKTLSANAKFRQIEPSRELVRQIEENLLGRRRLLEWRRAGFDPTRTAPLDDVPESKDRRAPIQETVFKQKLTFIAAAKTASSFPPVQRTEIAFAGRSNVGKSSLINALTRQWGVARTSEKPGLTQTINFFILGSELCMVDLPGYGFAFAKTQVKEDWEELVKEYVASRPNLKRVCLLVDAKWGLKPKDQELLQLMESSRTRYQIILTKTDVLPPPDLARRATQILQILKDHRCLVQPLMMVSSKSGAGLPHLRASLARVVSGHSNILVSHVEGGGLESI